MHYANGQEAKLGNLVYKPSEYPGGPEMAGVLVGGNLSSESCNATVSGLACRFHSDLGTTTWMPQATTEWCETLGKLLPLNPAAMPPDPNAPPPDDQPTV
jgi:hypothetical protein